MYLPIILIFVFSILFLIPIHSESITPPPHNTISGTFHDWEIYLTFNDNVASGTINNNDKMISFDNIKVIDRHDKFYIFDKQNNLKILSKQINENKYFVLVKLSDTKLRFITNIDEPNVKEQRVVTGQRNLFEAVNELQTESKELSFKEKHLLDQQKKVEESKRLFQERLSNVKNKVSSIGNNTNLLLENYTNTSVNNYDIPTKTRDDGKNKFFFILSNFEYIEQLRLNDDYELNYQLRGLPKGAFLNNTNVIVEISRDDYIIKTSSDKSNELGVIRIKIDDLSYPEFYPTLCYKLKIKFDYLNNTHTINDDFYMNYEINNRVFDPDQNWLNVERWNYLPEDFRKNPRETVRYDEHCNE